jgi:flagellar hook protein FlgE
VPSIVNGLFAGRSGIASHGAAIAVVGDNISNASTIGYKASRAEFEDLIAGEGGGGKTVGSGSSLAAVTTIFGQGTFEFTGRPLDLGIAGNGFFVVAQGEQRFYTRAGNFKVDSSGYVVNQNGLEVLGFPANASGALERLNVNTIEQSSVATTDLSMVGNVSAGATVISAAGIPATTGSPPTTSFADINARAAHSQAIDVFDSLGKGHTLTAFFFKTGATAPQYTVKMYARNEEVDATPGTFSGYPREVGSCTLSFGGDGQRTGTIPATDITASIAWNNGSNASSIDVSFSSFTQYSGQSNIQVISQDGKGIGAVTDISIDDSGLITAKLSNGQSANIGTIGLAAFSSPEGLTRNGFSLLSKSLSSGEPIVGRPGSGTLGKVKAGSLELSTTDTAAEFVRMITLQRGFQASARIITTINQLLNEIIQLA